MNLQRVGFVALCAGILSACGAEERTVGVEQCQLSWFVNSDSSIINLASIPDSARTTSLVWWHLTPPDPLSWFAERNATVLHRFHYQQWYLIGVRADSLRLMASDPNVIINLGARATGGVSRVYECL